MLKKIASLAGLLVASATILSAQTNIVWHSDMDFGTMPFRAGGGASLLDGSTVALVSFGSNSVGNWAGSTINPSDAQWIIDNMTTIASTQWVQNIGGDGLHGFYEDTTINSYNGVSAGDQAYFFFYDSLDANDLTANWLLVSHADWTLPGIPGTPTPGPQWHLGQAGLDVIVGGFDGNSLVAANPIPEPSTYALIFGLGILGFLGFRRFRK